jgi:isopentenyl diphosphate isomerase/L-lactate dehydrogenase-like FMN-dependent dehydrogenase
MTGVATPINVNDYEVLAQKCLPKPVWDYYYGGSEDEMTVRANREDFARLRLRPRMLVDVSVIDTRTTAMNAPIRMPILIAPSASQRMAHPDGELAMARAAGNAGTIMGVSTVATHSIEEIAQVATGPLWLQLYVYRNRDVSAMLVQRAHAAGYHAIMLTVDTTYLSKRERERRNNFVVPPPPLLAANFTGRYASETEMSPSLTWEMIPWLRSLSPLPILLKGILTAEDALLAVEHGVDGIIVSNHGGRQLDSAVSTIEALPEIVDAVAGRCEVYLDGGIRRGTDVIKALALGARAVLVGRAPLWGLAVNGQTGIEHVLDILREELEMAMALSGRPTLASIDRSLVKLER